MSADHRSQPQSTRKVVVASLIGTSLEWYDFFLYGSAAALVFNKLFFPEADPLTGTLLAFATSATGFIARPIGGIIFGHFGDKVGRKTVLVVTLLVMGIAPSSSACCRPMRPSAWPRPSCWSCSASSRGLGWAASGAGPC